MFTLATLAYLAGGIIALKRLMSDDSKQQATPVVMALTGFCLHTVSLGWNWAESGHFFVNTPFSNLSFLAWCAVLVFLLCYRIFSAPAALASFFLPVVVLFSAAALLISFVKSSETAGQLNWMMAAHGILMLVGYGAFAFAFVTGVMYLVQEHQLKAKVFGKLFRRMPSLAILDKMNVMAITIGFPLYTVSLLVAVTATAGSGKSPLAWVQSPLGFLGVVTWALYLCVVNVRFLTALRGKKAAYLTVLGFALVLFTLGLFFSIDDLHQNIGLQGNLK